MRTSILTAVTALLVASAAHAADVATKLPVKASPVVAPVEPWTGPYVGVHAGGGWADWRDKSILPAIAPAVYDGKFDGNGWIAGLQAGYQKQYGNFVVGFEGDLSWSNIDAGKTITLFGVNPDLWPKLALDYYGTFRAKAGYAVNTLLFYGTAGVAYGHVSHKIPFDIGPFTGTLSGKTDHIGWVAGLGLDWMISPQWTVGIDWQHFDFGTRSYDYNVGALLGAGGLNLGIDTSLKMDVVRASAKYRW